MNILKTTALCFLALLTLNACGGSDAPSSTRAAGAGKATTDTGAGDISFVAHADSATRRERFSLGNNSPHGKVYCELTPAGMGVISLGTFAEASYGINKSYPYVGLTVSVLDIRDKQSKLANQAFLNVGNTSVSSPTCTYFPAVETGPILKGSIQCMDNRDREGWGRVKVTANFECTP